MHIIPDLPTCQRTATVRYEIWTPQNGQAHGSLDGVAYACDEHSPDVVQAIHAAGLTPFRARDPQPGEQPARICGHLVDFGDPLPPMITHQTLPTIPPTTAPLPAADRRHPRWCTLGPICAEDHRHVSAVHTANPSGAYLYVRAWLEQAYKPGDAPVQLILEIAGDDGEVAEHRMELGQPRALAFVLRSLLRTAGAL